VKTFYRNDGKVAASVMMRKEHAQNTKMYGIEREKSRPVELRRKTPMQKADEDAKPPWKTPISLGVEKRTAASIFRGREHRNPQNFFLL
jgi:hypothetical protein